MIASQPMLDPIVQLEAVREGVNRRLVRVGGRVKKALERVDSRNWLARCWVTRSCGELRLSTAAQHPEEPHKLDIAHSGQTVVEAMEQLKVEVKNARRDRETVLLVVHGFGASGVGGAIKAAVSAELPRLARQFGFKAYGYAHKDRIPREQNIHARSLNPGSTLLIFREAQPAKDSMQDFRPNFRNLRSKVRVRARRAP